MQDLEYDVVVVGGGPAGSVTAKYAALGGARTLMIEKRQEIGSPVRCGEGIAKRWLDEINVAPNPRWISHEVDGAKLIAPDGSYVTIDEKHAGSESGYVIERDVFDKELAKDAIKAGADVMVKTSAIGVIMEGGYVKGVRARHMGEEFNIRAKVIVGADGFESQVGRWAGIDTVCKPKDIDSCYQYLLVGIEGDSRYNEFYMGSVAPGGYVWVFWKGKDSANVGIGVQLSKIKGRGEAKKYLERFIASHPNFAKGKAIEEVAGAVSICAPIDQFVANGIILVGDAARLIDPVSGGGIYYGCISGKIAGEVINEALAAKDFSQEFFMRYDKRLRNRLENTLYRNWMIKEKYTETSDETLNKIVGALAEYNLEKVGVSEILKGIESKYPELLKEFEDFL